MCDAIATEARIPHQLLFLSLAVGLLSSHSMVPPTPGPLAAAAALDADLSLVCLYGFVTSVCSSLLCAALIGSPPFMRCLEADLAAHDAAVARSRRASVQENESTADDALPLQSPHLAAASAPVLIPIALISATSISAATSPSGQAPAVLHVLGAPSVALMLGMLTALLLLVGVRHRRHAQWRRFLNEGLTSAAPIVILTGMGGALGSILVETGMTDAVRRSSSASECGLCLAVLLASALKVAQGSGTVAITVGASIMAPLMEEAGLGDPHGRALTAIALGAGSMIVPHVNDSYFWVFTRLLRCPLKLSFKLLTAACLVLGLSSVCAVLLIHTQPIVVAPILAALPATTLWLATLCTSRAGRFYQLGESFLARCPRSNRVLACWGAVAASVKRGTSDRSLTEVEELPSLNAKEDATSRVIVRG